MYNFIHHYFQTILKKDTEQMGDWYVYPYVMSLVNKNLLIENKFEYQRYISGLFRTYESKVANMVLTENKIWNHHNNIFQYDVKLKLLTREKEDLAEFAATYMVKNYQNNADILNAIYYNVFYAEEDDKIYLIENEAEKS